MFGNLKEKFIKKVIEEYIENDPAYVTDLLTRVAKKEPEKMANVLFTTLEQLNENQLEKHNKTLEKLLKVGLGKETWQKIKHT